MRIGDHHFEVRAGVFDGLAVHRAGPDKLLLLFKIFDVLFELYLSLDSLLVSEHFLGGSILVV